MPVTMEGPVNIRSHTVSGENLLSKVQEIIREGNARRIVVQNEDGRSVLELPLTAGVVGALVAPALVGIGAIAALAKHYTIVVDVAEAGPEKVDEEC